MKSHWGHELILGLALASFSPQAVRRAAAGAPVRLLAPALLVMAVGSGLREWRHRRRPTPDLRFIPDPDDADLTPIATALAHAVAQTSWPSRFVTLHLDPLESPDGTRIPYTVECRYADSRNTKTRNVKAHPVVHLILAPTVRLRSNARFRVEHDTGVRLTLGRVDDHGMLELWHDAPDPGWARGFDPIFVPVALLIWNLGRHGAFALHYPSLGLILLGMAAVAIRYQRISAAQRQPL